MRSCIKELIIFCFICAHSAQVYATDFKKRSTEEKVQFYVYTRENPKVAQALTADVESVIRNVLNPEKPTTFAIHNLLGNKNAEEYAIIRDTKLELEDGNVIIVDYSGVIKTEDLGATFALASHIAESCANLILLLHNFFDMNLQLLHVVGFSFGAQIAGLVGQIVAQRSNEKLNRITALDPVELLLNDTSSLNSLLSANDAAAAFVEVIHTNAGQSGILSPCGHIDYYPNGGRIQPGCNVNDTHCSHIRAYQLIPDMWLPNENQELLALRCSGIEFLGEDYCRWSTHRMGDLNQQLVKGLYYVETNENKPYGKGAFRRQFL